MTELALIQGAGGGGGSNGGSEASDTVRGTQIFDVLDLISEGECEGLVNGLQSIFFDGVPLQAADGTMNFAGVTVQTTPGTQGQAAIAGVDGVQNEIGVGVTVVYATPVVRSITNPAIDTCRVTIVVPQLSSANASTGDLSGSSFGWAIEVQSKGGGYVEVFRETLSAKTMSRYPRAQTFKLSGPAPWDIRVRRLTPDSTSANTVNAFGWSTYTKIQSVKLRYPNSCLIRSRGNAEQFSRVPVRSFDWLGRRIQVPKNYDPKTRVYTGIWDGTFKTSWSDNPAWIYHDMVVHNRYGLGRYIATTDSFKWELYGIGRYCDELVPDGYGGMEPRFRASPGFETREQAYKVLTDLAAIFRGIVFWLNEDVSVSQDAPSDPVAHFTRANVVPSEPGRFFSYTGSSNAARYSSVIVWFNDLSQQGKLVPEVVVHPDLEAELGVKPLELSPMGLWSRGQAHRIGQWALYSQEEETEGVAFKVGLDGVLVQPGKVFKVSDPNEAGERLAGRVSSASLTQVQLDADVLLRAGESYTLTVMLPDPTDSTVLTRQTRAVTTPAGTTRLLSVATAFTAAPARETIWLLESDKVNATTWRCIGVAETVGENTFTITGIAHQPGKYGLIDRGVAFTKPPVSRVLLTPPVPKGPLLLTESPYLTGAYAKSRVTVSWGVPLLGLSYLVRWRLNAGPWTELAWTNDNAVDVDGLAKGLFEASVRSRNALGNVSPELAGAVALVGWTKRPADVANFKATVVQGGVLFTWNPNQADNYLATTLKIGNSIIFEGAAGSWLWPWPALGTYTVTAVDWDTSLNVSTTPATVTVVVDVSVLTQWANLAGKPANLAALTGTEAIRNADILIGGVNLAQGSNDFGLFNFYAGSRGATGLVDPLGGASATRLTLTSSPLDMYRRFTGLRVGGTYTLSVWIKRETASRCFVTLTNTVSWGTGGSVTINATGWQRAVVSITTDTGSLDVAIGGHSQPAVAPQTPGTVIACFLQLEDGNTATQWALAPEDVAKLIATAQQTAEAAQTQLIAFSDDNVLDRTEKPAVRLDWETISGDRSGIDAQAVAYGITTERDGFDAAIDALAAYLSSIGTNPGDWYNTAVDSPINRDTFRTKWKQAYAAEQTLVTKISQVAGTLANWTGVSNRPQDLFNMVVTPTFEAGQLRTWNATDVAPVSGQAWTRALRTAHRDTVEYANPIPVSPGERLYVAADLNAQSATARFGFGVEHHRSPDIGAFDWRRGAFLEPGTVGWKRVSGYIDVLPGTSFVYPWIQLEGAPEQSGFGLATNLYIGRAQPGATLGADWNSNVANIPYSSVFNNDDSVALGFSMEDWPVGQAFPARWGYWNSFGPPPTRETTLVRAGATAVRWQTNGQAAWGMAATADLRNSPLPAGTFLQGSLDFYLVSFTSGQPGVLVRLYVTAALDNNYRELFVIPPSAAPGWQRVPWSLRANPGEKIYGIQVFLMPSPDGRAAPSTCDIVIDNFLFALFDNTTDNKNVSIGADGALKGGGGGQVSITGLGYVGELDATHGANWATNVVGAAAVNQAIADAQHAALTAQNAAANAQRSADSANSGLAAISSDSVLSPAEKPEAILDWQVIAGEKDGILASAANYGVDGGTYNGSIGALAAYLNSLGPYGWADLSGPSTIDGPTFRSQFAAVYVTRQAVLNAISAAAKSRLGALATLNQVGTDQIAGSAVSFRVVFSDAAGAIYNPTA